MVLRLNDEIDVIALITEGLMERNFGRDIGYHLGRALGIRDRVGCFDVYGENYRGEFPAAYVLQLIATQKRFHIFMRIISISSGVPAVGFAPFIGLSNYKDSNTLVGGYYREWYFARRRRVRDAQGEGSRTGFANAVAALLGAQGAETDLTAYLDETYENFVNELGEALALHPPTNASDDPSHVTEEIFYKEPGWYKDNALEYMRCLALSWMHFEDRRNEGGSPSDISVPGFPSGPTSTWLSRPTVPGTVVQEESVPALVSCDITGTQPVDPFEEEGIPEGPSASALLRDECREKGPVPPPDLGKIEEVELHTFTVGEDQSDVNTGIDLYTYDSVSFGASGSIWAGVWFTGENGPKGWED
jgi:hypothetical protein